MTESTAKKPAKKPSKKPAKKQSAEDYNEKQAGKLWNWADLPSHLASLRKRPRAALVEAVKTFQKKAGLAADGKIGPKTIAKIRAVFPQFAPPGASPAAAAAAEEDDSGSG